MIIRHHLTRGCYREKPCNGVRWCNCLYWLNLEGNLEREIAKKKGKVNLVYSPSSIVCHKLLIILGWIKPGLSLNAPHQSSDWHQVTYLCSWSKLLIWWGFLSVTIQDIKYLIQWIQWKLRTDEGDHEAILLNKNLPFNTWCICLFAALTLQIRTQTNSRTY